MIYEYISFFQRIHWPFRRKLQGQHKGKRIVLDGLWIENANIVECHIVYGGGPCTLSNSSISRCSKIEFFGSAASTLALLKAFDGENNSIIERTFPKTFARVSCGSHPVNESP